MLFLFFSHLSSNSNLASPFSIPLQAIGTGASSVTLSYTAPYNGYYSYSNLTASADGAVLSASGISQSYEYKSKGTQFTFFSNRSSGGTWGSYSLNATINYK